MKLKAKISIALLLSSPLVAAGYILLDGDDAALAQVHEGITRQFAEVSHIDGDALSVLSQEDIILLDVREAPEFAVSHLKGAIRIDPEIPTADFIEKFADTAKGKTVIFYCSVGQRSSSLADRVQGALLSSGAKATHNLEGGIFKWHNERRPLYTGPAVPTEYVHPYDAIWGRMVKDRKTTRYQVQIK